MCPICFAREGVNVVIAGLSKDEATATAKEIVAKGVEKN
jgi:cytochrome c-type biogenesis protein CcmE